MAELIHEYLNRLEQAAAPQTSRQEALTTLQAMRQEELLTHPGWEWYRRQIAEKAESSQRVLRLLADEIVYGNELGEALVEKKMRARGLQAEVHVYETVLVLVREAAQKLTGPEASP